MVYCTKCGHHNPDDSKYCVMCGASLDFLQSTRRTELGKRSEPECFGLRWSGAEWSLLGGTIIVLLGVFWLLERYLAVSWGNVWGILVIAFGVIVILRRLARSRS